MTTALHIHRQEIIERTAQLIVMRRINMSYPICKADLPDDAEKEEMWGVFLKQHGPVEQGWADIMVDLFSKQADRVVSNIYANPMKSIKELTEAQIEAQIDSWLLNLEDEIRAFGRAGRPQVEQGVNSGGMLGMAEVGSFAGFDPTLERVQRFIDDKTFKFSYEVNSTTQARLRTLFKESIEAGDGARATARKVRDLFARWQGEDIGTSRSMLIARTETTGAVNFGTQEGYTQSGVVKKNRWLAARDERTRDDHVAVDGTVVKVGERFPIVNIEYPGDPSGDISQLANCRCALSPVIEPIGLDDE